jgi:hypothetical protein
VGSDLRFNSAPTVAESSEDIGVGDGYRQPIHQDDNFDPADYIFWFYNFAISQAAERPPPSFASKEAKLPGEYANDRLTSNVDTIVWLLRNSLSLKHPHRSRNPIYI